MDIKVKPFYFRVGPRDIFFSGQYKLFFSFLQEKCTYNFQGPPFSQSEGFCSAFSSNRVFKYLDEESANKNFFDIKFSVKFLQV